MLIIQDGRFCLPGEYPEAVGRATLQSVSHLWGSAGLAFPRIGEHIDEEEGSIAPGRHTGPSRPLSLVGRSPPWAVCALSLLGLLRRLPTTTAFLRYLVARLDWRRTTPGLWRGALPVASGFAITLGGWRLLALAGTLILVELLPVLMSATALWVFGRPWGRGLLPFWQRRRLQFLLAAAVSIFYRS